MSTSVSLTQNWYAEPFTKRTSCEIPGQCGGECNCGCPYNTMTELETLPLIEEIAEMFPDEWLVFIISSEEDDDPFPVHGKLVAHSPDPDEIFDAANIVLWNQCVYTFFNGSLAAMEASYGDMLAVDERTVVHAAIPKDTQPAPPVGDPVPEKLLDLVYSGLDKLYQQPVDLSEAIRRFRIAKMRLNFNPDSSLNAILDRALNHLEVASPAISEAIWELEEALVEAG